MTEFHCWVNYPFKFEQKGNKLKRLSRLELIQHMQVKGANVTSQNKNGPLENNC